MPIYRYPVLTWLDASGAATAVLVGDVEHAAARAASATEALRQLHEMLEWRVEHEPWNVAPDLSEAVLFETRVEARPEYVHDDRRTPCPDTLQLRVPCVKGVQGGGLPVCVVPHLKVVFNFQDEEGIKGLITHYVKEALQSESPAALVARLPPRSCELGELVLRVAGGRERKVPVAEREEYKALFNVAEPLLHDLRRQPKPSAAHGREATSFILSLMLRGDMSSLLLVGEAGCGKSTLLRDAARQAVREEYKSREGESKEDDSEKDLRTYRFWRGTAGRLIAGMRFLGEWEQRCEEFVEQMGAVRGVFCAENLLEL
ncbi:MAG TPA: hypothetical protein VMF06_21035, partial [Candidatus Limnocylindria bacterium]|nr:hypothetical protein [Candidatus Limnocylindria bacterium]